MHTYMKNNPAKFHPDLIWNIAALSFFRGRPNKNSSDRSVPDLKKILVQTSRFTNTLSRKKLHCDQ